MFKVQLICLALCSATGGVYISRMSTVNRMRVPTAFRPGINMRPWTQTRLVQAASHRAPYVLYRNPTQRFAFKQYGPSPTRSIFPPSSMWKTRIPDYEFVKAASTPQVHTDGGTGAIHTIPAPNLSLAEKPIVVAENTPTEQPKQTYEVTEKYQDGEINAAKIETPIGFSKPSFSAPDVQTLLRGGPSLQLAPEFSLPTLSVNQHIAQPYQQIPQQFTMQAINLPPQRDLINTGTEGIFLPPNTLYQTDPLFMQKLQNQLLQRFQAVEFIPYGEIPNQIPNLPHQITNQIPHQIPNQIPNQVHLQPQPQASQNQQIFLLENEQLNEPHQVVKELKNVVQRETPENNVATLVPQAFTVHNSTEKPVEVTTAKQNITVELVAAESKPITTTIKYVIDNLINNTTPIYYAQVGQSVGNVIANGFYSAINDVRAAAALAQVEKAETNPPENITTTPTPEIRPYFVAKDEKVESNNKTEMRPLVGVPFSKPNDNVNVAYTLVRTDEKPSKVNQEGAIYAGQIIEASISEDHDYNKEKASIMSKRAPIRLYAVTDSKIADTNSVPKVTVVKAKIPPKSRLTFDDNGEPVLRIYASYVDSPAQKDAVIAKLAKDAITKRESIDSFRSATVKALDKPNFDRNQVTQFGVKLRQRSDDYIPLFAEYED